MTEKNDFFCTVVQWARSCFHGHMKRVRLPVTLISVTLYRSFFLFSFCFLMLIFFLSCFPDLYSYCWPCWSCSWIMKIYILSLSPESFILEKGFQELLTCILATLTARKKKAVKTCPSSETVVFSLDVSWRHDKQHTVTPQTLLTYTQNPLAKFKLAICTSS